MKRLSTIFVILLIVVKAYPSSILGGDFRWDCIGEDSFMVTLTLYNDCNGDKPGNIDIDVYCKGGQKLQSLNILTSTPVDITSTCDNAKTRCDDPNSDFPFGIQQYTYQKLLVLDPALSCCEILLSFQECCRSLNIDNGGAGTVFYTDAMFNRCLTPQDNSPRCTNPPIAMIVKDFKFHFCNGVTDFDIGPKGGLMDSLAYTFAYPETDQGPVTFTPPYDYDKPLMTKGSFILDPWVGSLHFTPTKTEKATFRVKFMEYRDGQLIAYFNRDYYMAVVEDSNLHPPQIVSDDFFTSVFAGHTAKIVINSYDPDLGDSLRFRWNAALPGAEWTDSTYNEKHPTAYVSWTPGKDMISDIPYTFNVEVRDDHCPVNQNGIRSFQVLVKDPDIGIREENLKLSIYPNPANDYLIIKGEDELKRIQLFDLNGKLILEKNHPEARHYTLDLSALEKGIYLLKLDDYYVNKIIIN